MNSVLLLSYKVWIDEKEKEKEKQNENKHVLCRNDWNDVRLKRYRTHKRALFHGVCECVFSFLIYFTEQTLKRHRQKQNSNEIVNLSWEKRASGTNRREKKEKSFATRRYIK